MRDTITDIMKLNYKGAISDRPRRGYSCFSKYRHILNGTNNRIKIHGDKCLFDIMMTVQELTEPNSEKSALLRVNRYKLSSISARCIPLSVKGRR